LQQVFDAVGFGAGEAGGEVGGGELLADGQNLFRQFLRQRPGSENRGGASGPARAVLPRRVRRSEPPAVPESPHRSA